MHPTQDGTQGNRREIAAAFLKLGFTAYGGPAILGIMQAELQEKRAWVSKERFMEGLALVNMLPGAAATQLGIFLGYARGGWWGGLLAGLCFVLPAFLIMLALTLGYAAFSATPLLRGALYGLGPVVLAIFAAALWRLGRASLAGRPQLLVAAAAALASASGILGVAPILALAGAAGVLLFHSRRTGLIALGAIAALLALAYALPSPLAGAAPAGAGAAAPGWLDLGAFFLMVGTFSFGGGLTLVAFIQDQVVNHYQWLTPREFIDGLALGQLTPGPILMVSAYVGYKSAGLGGAALAAAATFAPAFVLMLSLLPVLERARKLLWTRAAMKAIGPAAIAVLAVSLAQMAPHAVPDPFALVVFGLALAALFVWRIGVLKLMGLGAALGALRSAASS